MLLLGFEMSLLTSILTFVLLTGGIMQYAHGLIIDDNPTVHRDVLISKLKEIKQYCLDHTDRILAGGNPVQDLINAGMIRSDIFQNITCQNIDNEILWTELGKGEHLKDALGID